MKTENVRWRRYFAVILLILAIFNGYLLFANASQQGRIAELQSQISSIGQSCRAFYTKLSINLSALSYHVSVLTSTLYGQIREDNATIAKLNTTKPPGYENTTAILEEEIRTDQSIISALNNLIPTYAGLVSGTKSNPCG